MELAKEYRSRLEAALGDRLKDVRVFGSRARGDARPDSDLDIFVLLDEADRPTRYQVIDLATDLCLETNYQFDISPLVMDEARFRRLLAHERRISLDIQNEGIPV